MSGRDLRSFLSQHRSGTFHIPKKNVAAELTKKYVCGSSHGRGRNVDYEELLNKARRHKETASRQLRHVKMLTCQNNERKEAELLQLHREVWTKEMSKLLREICVVEAELDRWRKMDLEESFSAAGGLDRREDVAWIDVAEYEMELAAERKQFEVEYMEPVREMTMGLRNWVKAREKVEAEQVGVVCRTKLTKELCPVQEKLQASWRNLESERVLLEGSLDCYELEKRKYEGLEDFEGAIEGGTNEHECDTLEHLDLNRDNGSVLWVDVGGFGKDPGHGVVGGVPAALLGCSSAELCVSLAEELASLDVHYRGSLLQLKDKHHQALSCPHGGWAVEDASKFSFIMDQYPAAMKGHSRRELYLDRLAREFPQCTRQQLTWASLLDCYGQSMKTSTVFPPA